MNFNLNKKEKELLMYCVLAFVTGYLICMYFPVHGTNNVIGQVPVLEGVTNKDNKKGDKKVDRMKKLEIQYPHPRSKNQNNKDDKDEYSVMRDFVTTPPASKNNNNKNNNNNNNNNNKQ